MELQSRYLTWVSDSPTTMGWSVFLWVWPQAGRLCVNWKARNTKVGLFSVVNVRFGCKYHLWLLQEVRRRRNGGARTLGGSGTAKEKRLANLAHL